MSQIGDIFTMDEAEMLRHFLRRIDEATTIPPDRRKDLAFLQSAASLAHTYARCALKLELPVLDDGAGGGPRPLAEPDAVPGMK